MKDRTLPWRSLFPVFLFMVGLAFPDSSQGAMEHRYIFFPERELVGTPGQLGLPYEEARFPAKDGVPLHGWYIPGTPDLPLVLFCHGNAGNISHRLDNLLLFHRLGVSVFIFDYRGYGQSAGKTSEEGTYNDARGALTWLAEKGWSPARMIYFGRSLGAGVAVQLALENPPGGLVLESPFPSIAAMGWHHNPIIYLLLGWALDARYDNLDKIGKIQVPLLLFQGTQDAIVPEKMARQVFARANGPKTYHPVAGAGHNDTYEKGGSAYWETWQQFMDQHFRPPGEHPDRESP